MKKSLFLSLGSNIEPKISYLDSALLRLNSFFEFVKSSSIYETEPLLDFDQDSFYNLVALYKTEITDPFEILKIVKSIENDIGRVKDENRPKGPRIIDIDVILFGEVETDTDELCIPHKSFSQRNFVLIPLKEIIGSLSDFSIKYDIDKFIEKNKFQNVKKLNDN